VHLFLIKARRLLARLPVEAWRVFCAPIFETGQLIGLSVAVLGTFIALTQTPLSGWASKLNEWIIPVQAFGYVLIAWGLISVAVAPFRVVASDRKSGKWQGHHYVYREPKLVFSGRFEHKDGDTQPVSLDFADAEPGSFVSCKVEADPNVADRVLTFISGGRPNHSIAIFRPEPKQVTLFAHPGAHIGCRLPQDKDATMYVRLEPKTVPCVLRVYCIEFFAGKDDADIGPSPWRKAMTSLQKARSSGQVEKFIAEHEADPEGDADKLDALIKRPVQETVSEARPASPPAKSGD
jgi:hypothetical protein